VVKSRDKADAAARSVAHCHLICRLWLNDLTTVRRELRDAAFACSRVFPCWAPAAAFMTTLS
jgi:hypothetical protein